MNTISNLTTLSISLIDFDDLESVKHYLNVFNSRLSSFYFSLNIENDTLTISLMLNNSKIDCSSTDYIKNDTKELYNAYFTLIYCFNILAKNPYSNDYYSKQETAALVDNTILSIKSALQKKAS